MRIEPLTTSLLTAAVIVAPFIAPPEAAGQEGETGGLVGVVRSEAGRPLGQVDVHVPSVGRHALTEADGSFRMAGLPARALRVRFQRPGYESTVREVTLEAGSVAQIEVTLSTRPFTAREIVVTGTPSAADPLETTQEVDAVDADAMARVGTASLGKLLEETVPGVQSISTGSQVGKPVLRGLSGSRVRFLQNGVAQDFFQYGVRHSPPTSMSQAERVEVVRGASSILYGSDALGGAVNIITKDLPSAPDDRIRVGGEVEGQLFSNNDEWAGLVDLHAAGSAFGVRAGVELREAGNMTTPDAPTFFRADPRTGVQGDPKYTGEVPFTDFEQWSAYGQVGVRGDAGSAELFLNHWSNRQNFLLPVGGPVGSADNPPVGLGQNIEQTNATLEGTLVTSGVSIRPTLSWQRALRQSAAPGNPIESDPSFPVDLLKDSWTARVEASHPAVAGLEGTVGTEINYQDTESRGPVELEPASEILNFGLFAFEELPLDRLTLSFGARLDLRSQEAAANDRTDLQPLLESKFSEVTGGVGFNDRLADGLALASNLSTGFRAPSIFELYASGVHGGVAAFQRGNPLLDAERSWSGDLSLRARMDRVRGKLTGYVNRIQDYIFLANTGESTDGGLPVLSADQTDATLRGVEGNVEILLHDLVSLGGSFSAIDHEGEGLTDPDGDAGDGPLPLIPADRIDGFVRLGGDDVGPFGSPRLRLKLRHAFDKDAAGRIEPFSQFDGAPFGTASTESYTVFGLEASGTVETGSVPISVTVAVENLTDEVYREFLDTYKGYALSPGRNLSLKIRAPLHFTD